MIGNDWVVGIPAAGSGLLAHWWAWLTTTRWRWVVVGVAVLAVASLLATWRWFVAPSATAIDDVARSDAVVLFVGGRGERLDTALEVVAANKAPVLVIPNGTTPGWPDANALCDGSIDVGVEVLCPTPEPDTTRGEARAIAALGAEYGWDSVVAVTSTYHLERALLMLGRCFEGDVTAVEASPDLSIWGWGTKLVHEWAGVAQAHVVERGC